MMDLSSWNIFFCDLIQFKLQWLQITTQRDRIVRVSLLWYAKTDVWCFIVAMKDWTQVKIWYFAGFQILQHFTLCRVCLVVVLFLVFTIFYFYESLTFQQKQRQAARSFTISFIVDSRLIHSWFIWCRLHGWPIERLSIFLWIFSYCVVFFSYILIFQLLPSAWYNGLPSWQVNFIKVYLVGNSFL